MRTAWMVVVLASLTGAGGCNLLFRADGTDPPAVDAPVDDAPPQNPDQPILGNPGIEGQPHVDDIPTEVFASVRGVPNRTVRFSAETVQGGELGNFLVPMSVLVLDGEGMGRIEAPWQATGFGNVKVRFRAAYDTTPLEDGNVTELDFKTLLDVGNYDLGGNVDFFTLPPDTLHGFLLTFPEAGRIVSVGIVTEGLNGGQVAFGLYTATSLNQPKDLIMPPTNAVNIDQARVESTLDHQVSANGKLYLTINLSQSVKLRHNGLGAGSFVAFGNTVGTVFPGFTSVFPIEGDLNDQAFAVYATIEP